MNNNTTNAKSEFELNKEIYSKSLRGSYLILPVLIKSGKEFCKIGLKEIPISKNALEDKSKLITKRCNSGYIKKYLFEEGCDPFELYLPGEDVTLSDFQLFMFDNGIGFISLITVCENKDVSKIYNLVNNEYVGTDDEGSNSYTQLYDSLTEIISPNNLEIYLEREDINLLLNESYVFNFALVTERFNDLETLRLLSENVHKQIGLERKELSNYIDEQEFMEKFMDIMQCDFGSKENGYFFENAPKGFMAFQRDEYSDVFWIRDDLYQMNYHNVFELFIHYKGNERFLTSSICGCFENKEAQ